MSRKLKMAFYLQRSAAKRRGISFELTFEQWLNIWERSGKIAQRGRKRGQYQMARFGDVGPYSIDNVAIITVEENQREFQSTPKGKSILKKLIKISSNPSDETRRKISLAGKGVPKPSGFGQKISDSHKHRTYENISGPNNPNSKLSWKAIHTIRKEYSSKSITQKQLSIKFGVSKSTIGNVVSGKYYVED